MGPISKPGDIWCLHQVQFSSAWPRLIFNDFFGSTKRTAFPLFPGAFHPGRLCLPPGGLFEVTALQVWGQHLYTVRLFCSKPSRNQPEKSDGIMVKGSDPKEPILAKKAGLRSSLAFCRLRTPNSFMPDPSGGIFISLGRQGKGSSNGQTSVASGGRFWRQ